MPALQEQNKDCPDPYPLCRKAALPGIAVDEHCGENVY